MTMCVSRPQADSFTGHAKNVTFLQLTDLMNDAKIMNWISLLEISGDIHGMIQGLYRDIVTQGSSILW